MIPSEDDSWTVRIPQGLAWLLGVGVALGGASLLLSGWSYYVLDPGEQALHHLDPRLRSAGQVGLGLGLLAAGLMVLNVLYLVRRNLQDRLRFLGTLRSWMTIHVATGLAAPVVALFHSAFTLRTPLGAGALLLMGAAALIGLVGRYLYSVVPRGASGRELQLSQVRAAADVVLRELEGELGAQGALADAVHAALDTPLRARKARWVGGWILVLALGDLERWRRIRALGRGLRRDAARGLLPHVDRALRLRLQAERHEVLNQLMGTWRAAHRWLALATSLLLLGHVYVALTYARLWLS